MAPRWSIFPKSKTSHNVLSLESSKTNHKVLFSESICETVKGSHEYKIKGYSLAKGMGVGKSMISRTFTVGGHDWFIRFHPDGYTQDSQEYISVFLQPASPGEVRATLEFKLQDQSGKGEYGVHSIVISPITFNGAEAIRSWGFPKYMKRSELETSSYLKDDCFIIHCTVGIVQTLNGTVETRVVEEKPYIIHVTPSDMNQNLKGLLESEIGYDVTFHVGNEYFRAHKLILAARSPVFRAQFFGLMGNPGMETIAIKEFEPFAFKAMLLFLYSDTLPEPRELSKSNSVCTSTTLMQHLLDAADRYDLARLKLMCEAKLCEEISANTVATTLVLAEQHQCLQLKIFCLNFAAKPENLGKVMKSDGYAYLEKSCPSLLADLLKTIAMLSSKTIYETVKDSHEYMIQGFSLAKGIGVGKFKSSRTFTVGGHDWVIRFYPGGETIASEEYISLYLKIVSPGEVRATFEFKLLHQSEKGKYGVHKISECGRTFNAMESSSWYVGVLFRFLWGYAEYMKRSELETSSYLKDDCLSIHCTIGIVQTRDETVARVEEEKGYVIPPSDMIQNLKGMLESEIGSDITFHVGNEFFRAHKSILAARSPVFRAQFFGLVGDPDMETIVIKEFEPFAFKAMLLFVYSDNLPEPREVSDSDSPCTTTTLMQHLVAAADRYDLARLKLMCEAKLFEEITADTVATTLALAERYRCLQLKTDCLNFAARPENLGGKFCV
ncbi:hypothetical protein MKW92_032787 [Papaver armeniacum]|nr:hypothetical protein MKW92_032787 [Papaver armeniacum]